MSAFRAFWGYLFPIVHGSLVDFWEWCLHWKLSKMWSGSLSTMHPFTLAFVSSGCSFEYWQFAEHLCSCPEHTCRMAMHKFERTKKTTTKECLKMCVAWLVDWPHLPKVDHSFTNPLAARVSALQTAVRCGPLANVQIFFSYVCGAAAVLKKVARFGAALNLETA